MRLAIIILAAGNSRRFGENKLLFEIEGVPMYKRVLRELCIAGDILEKTIPELTCDFTIVTQYSEILSYGEKHHMKGLINPHPEDGIASSLKIGLQANTDSDAALFAVADQPWLKSDTVIKITEKLLSTDKHIVCPAVMEEGKVRLGNPCYFLKKYYSELLALTGDTGGKQVVKRHMDDTDIIYLKEKNELEDIDYKAEL